MPNPQPEQAKLMPLMTDMDTGTKILMLPLLANTLMVARRRMHSTVRVATMTHKHEQLVGEALTLDWVQVENVRIGCTNKALLPIRAEGTVTILPVVEEVVVAEHQLHLEDEIHIRRQRRTERHQKAATLPTQDARRHPHRGGTATGWRRLPSPRD